MKRMLWWCGAICATYAVAWFGLYVAVMGGDFRYVGEFLRLGLTGEGLELASLFHVFAAACAFVATGAALIDLGVRRFGSCRTRRAYAGFVALAVIVLVGLAIAGRIEGDVAKTFLAPVAVIGMIGAFIDWRYARREA